MSNSRRKWSKPRKATKKAKLFLPPTKAKKAWSRCPAGLEYKNMTAGTGPKPTTTDSVVCNYRGTLINGTQFDALTTWEPATFL